MPKFNHSDRTSGSVVVSGRRYYPIGLTVAAGWTDDRGRQYDADFRLVCEECGGSYDEYLEDKGAEDGAGRLVGRVTTDAAGQTLCSDCRADRNLQKQLAHQIG